MADPSRTPFMPSSLNSYLPSPKSGPQSMSSAFRLDEGFSEDTRSQAGSELLPARAELDQDISTTGDLQVPEWLLAMTESDRSEFAYALLRSLRTSSIAAIVQRLNPLLHIDPILYLPPEVTYEVLSFLDPQSLLRSSTLSRQWRSRALDPGLWKKLFAAEGWSVNVRQLKEFEQTQRARFGDVKGKARARPSEEITDPESKSPKRRVRGRLAFGDDVQDMVMESSYETAPDTPRLWDEQHGIVEADEDEKMEDVQTARSFTEQPPQVSPVKMEDIYPLEPSQGSSKRPALKAQTPSSDALNPPTKTSLLLARHGGDLSMNWQYLYKQKRRLEENWQLGKFKNFQLPHPSHAHEAHTECVYTIQYTGKHLVSGSRDKTLRIWDLDTHRLMVPPLCGHSASVLCLQFDDRPEQDIVISGGSDNCVILWQFSTGKMIRKIEQAHGESVLNLRFDDRFLVTCSKDKTIKVWNRTLLHPTDPWYPSIGGSTSAKFPSYIINMDNMLMNHANLQPLQEYSLLMTLHGHTAAVNAIQILDNQIVSASGDRHVKIWDVHTGQCLKTIPGHQKGIACVQFDGRRIVSGSSDETVRIFDRHTGAEVACLRGHANLVRTVQARFGDLPGGAIDEENEARSVDARYYQAKLSGALPKEMTREQRRTRNAGSSDPKDIFALGAKLPPGGGGSKWARIVSGSYDETIIIWKRNADGKWKPAQQLHQWEAVLNAGGQPRYPNPRLLHMHPLPRPPVGVPAQVPPNPAGANQHAVQANQAATIVQRAHMQLAQAQVTIAHAQALLSQHHNGPNHPPNATANNSPAVNGNSIAAQAGSAQSASSSTTPTQNHQTSSTGATQTTTTTVQSPQQSTTQNPQWAGTIPHHPNTDTTTTDEESPSASPSQSQAQAQSSTSTSTAPSTQQQPAQQQASQTSTTTQTHTQQVMNPPTGPAQGTPAAAAQAQGGQGQHPAHPHPAHAHVHHVHGAHATGAHANSRVFKLQFDSRRIICCSQDPTIVGWDFANGEKEIEEASRFFGDDW